MPPVEPIQTVPSASAVSEFTLLLKTAFGSDRRTAARRESAGFTTYSPLAVPIHNRPSRVARIERIALFHRPGTRFHSPPLLRQIPSGPAANTVGLPAAALTEQIAPIGIPLSAASRTPVGPAL